MRLIVVDPRILVRAFTHPRSDPARLLALASYGRVSINAHGFPLQELEHMAECARQEEVVVDVAVRARAERDIDEAKRRKAMMEQVFEQIVPDDLLLVTSPPLLTEFVGLAQRSQRRHPMCIPTARHATSPATHSEPVRNRRPPPTTLGVAACPSTTI